MTGKIEDKMLPSATLIPEKVLTLMYVPSWNLGDVCFTVGLQQLLESENEDEAVLLIWQHLEAHLWGHAGLASDDETHLARMQRGRVEGRPFTSVWLLGGEVMKIVTNQVRRITTVCLVRED